VNLSFIVPLLYPGAIVSCLLSLWRPRIGIYFLVLVLPLQTLRYEIQSYPFGGSIIDFVLLAVVIGALLQRKEPLFGDLPLKGLLLVSFAYWYISLWHGSFFVGLPKPLALDDLRFSFWKAYIELGLIYFVAFAAIRTREQIRTVLVLMCVALMAISLDFYGVVSTEDLSHFSDSGRYAGVLGYAGVNGLAAFVSIMGLFLAALVTIRVGTKLRTIAFIALLGCVYCLLFAFSRGAYLSFAGGLLLIALLQKRYLLAFGLTGLFGLALVLPGAVSERISGTYVQTGSGEEVLESSAQERVIIWEDAISLIRAFPLQGTGFQTYPYMHRSLGYGDTHNFYLKVMVEEGLIGIVIFLAILGQMFKQGIRLFRSATDPFYSAIGVGFAGCVAGAAIANIFGDRWTYMQVDSYLWILLALVARAHLLSASAETEQVSAVDDPSEAGAAFRDFAPVVPLTS
jgi:putative inorganic carbon (hco3(-)) transporter